MRYSLSENKDIEQLRQELIAAWIRYDEASSPKVTKIEFGELVELFAKDDFYHLHLVAQRYLQLREKEKLKTALPLAKTNSKALRL